MRIVLSGVETNNKGAELMLYAILQEIERKDSNATVYLSQTMVRQGVIYLNTKCELSFIPQSLIARFFQRIKLTSILNRLGLRSAWLNNKQPIKSADYFIDGSGLLFSDSRISSMGVAYSWEAMLKGYKKEKTKIVFLPQAFGPFKKRESSSCVKVLARYADAIIARDRKSYQYLLPFDRKPSILSLYPDFTTLVRGVVPNEYDYLKGYVCIIPNIKMTLQYSVESYLGILHLICNFVREQGYGIYLLNHEGKDDDLLIEKYKKTHDPSIEVVTGLNALEIKGVISTAYLVISSRFHGLVSSLNSCVPCLSTSWHHKYTELYNDYGVENGVLQINDQIQTEIKIQEYLNVDKNKEMRRILSISTERIKQKNRQMWKEIWSL